MTQTKLDLLQGTLDLMVLQTLASMGSLHGYGIARRIEQVSGDEVLLNQGTIYASLVRLQQREWISAEWGTSDNNRKAKYYSITKEGRRQLAKDAAYWRRLTSVMGRVLSAWAGEEACDEPARDSWTGEFVLFINRSGRRVGCGDADAPGDSHRRKSEDRG